MTNDTKITAAEFVNRIVKAAAVDTPNGRSWITGPEEVRIAIERELVEHDAALSQAVLKRLLDQKTIAAALYRAASDHPDIEVSGPFTEYWETILATAVIEALERRALPLRGLSIQADTDHDAALAAAQEQLRPLLLKHGFVRISCGDEGKIYYECKECRFSSAGHEHVERTPELAKHEKDCALDAAICALPLPNADASQLSTNRRDERIRLEARQFQHEQDCRWALTQPMVCPTCNELAELEAVLREKTNGIDFADS